MTTTLPDDLRPKTADNYIGQTALKDRLSIHTTSARRRGERLDHVLLVGPPGCGKTTISQIIAAEMRQEFLSFVMPLEPKLLAGIVRNFRGIVLFDEIHRAAPKQQEQLLTVVEDGYLQMPNGSRFSTDGGLTIVAATTEPEKVIAPLYDRFPIKPVYDDYTDEEMTAIVKQKADYLGLPLEHDTAAVFGRAAGGTPRNAAAFVVMARDLMVARGVTPTAQDVLKSMRVTEDGLTEDHVRYLSILEKVGGVAGLKVLSTHLRLPESFLMDLERLLVKQNLIEFTAKGRELRGSGWKP